MTANDLQPGLALPPRTVVARNTAAHEAGSIHDDAQAERFGYRGGLVPGVTLLAYLTPSLIAAFGEAWLRRGRLAARFRRPAYHDDTVVARATVSARYERGVSLRCAVERDGAVCVEAEASCALGETPVDTTPWRRGIPSGHPPPALDGGLPPLSAETLSAGQELSPLTYRLSPDEAARWAADADDDYPWYRTESPFGGPVIHPACFARDPIHLLRHNFAYKATVHASTDLTYRGAGFPGRDHTVYGYVVDVYERRGHDYAVIDTLTIDEDGREIARNRHVSLITLRGEKAGGSTG